MTRNLALDLESFGGAATRAQLLGLGHTPRAVSAAVRAGAITVPRRGWIAWPGANRMAARAIELGGILGGASALASYGIWVDATHALVVACAPTASRLQPLGAGEHRVWAIERFPVTGRHLWRISVRDALLQHATMCSPESLVASIDSALNTGRLRPVELHSLYAAMPRRLRRTRSLVDGRAMSGTETKLRLALVRAGFRAELQVAIDGVGRVDIVVDGWLIIEVDSERHHGADNDRRRDRRRDAHAILAGHDTIRFDYWDVQEHLAWCVSVIEAKVRSRA